MQKTARPPLAFGQVWGTGGVSSHEKGERGRRKAEDGGGGGGGGMARMREEGRAEA